MKSEIRYYVSVFLRRIHYFLLAFAAVATAGISTALVLPPVYQSSATMVVESPQIPQNLAASTVQAGRQEQLEIIRQRLMTRANLLDIERQVGLYPNRQDMSADEVVAQMKSETGILINGGRDSAMLFEISFRAHTPEKAFAVTNALMTRVLEDNVQIRTNRAVGTMDFFEQELARLGTELEQQSARILEFKNENLGALPDNMQYLDKRRDDLRDRIVQIRRELTSLDQQKERLLIVANAGGGDNANLISPAERRLRELQAELDKSLAIYSDANPKVRALRTQIEALSPSVDTSDSPESGESGASSVLDLQLREIENSRKSLEDELVRVGKEVETIGEQIAKIPENTIRLDKLNRDFEMIQRQYDQAVERTSTAETGERIELLSKGERITVLNQPVRPTEPSSPDRKRIMKLSIVAALASGLGLVFALEFLNGSIRRPADLTRSLGITPFATIPLMRTPREIVRRRATILTSLVAVSAGAAAVVIYTHTQIMPLDLVAEKAIERMGL